jgi:hypothetical protein
MTQISLALSSPPLSFDRHKLQNDLQQIQMNTMNYAMNKHTQQSFNIFASLHGISQLKSVNGKCNKFIPQIIF